MQNIKEYWQKLSDKTKKLLIAIVAGTVAIAILAVAALKMTEQKDYSVLFTGLNQEEAQQVVALLQDQGYPYRYDDRNGSIQMPTSTVDQARVQLLSEGYPKSGFTYDMYRNNSGLMSTESDKKQYTRYELQDRLGAQIRLFEGVQDAKVTIAEAGEQKYALGDETSTEASAAVTVTMKKGQTLTSDQASAIKNLISRSVRGMNFTSVSVFDAETMTEVGSDDGTGSSGDYTELVTEIENHIAANVRRVLEKLYGQGKVAVAVKGTLNTDKLIQEITRYNVPEKIDEEDKTGLLHREETSFENSGTTGEEAGGVAGADANADTPRYTANNGGGTISDNYSNGTAAREWLFDSIREQRQVDPGVLENTTIGVVIDTDDTSIPERNLVNLVANSAGISQEEAAAKITIIRALSADSKEADSGIPVVTPPGEPGEEDTSGLPLPLIIALIAGGVLLLLILILLLTRRGRKKDTEEEAAEIEDTGEPAAWPETAEAGEAPPETEAVRQIKEEDAEMEQNEEILNLRMQRSLKLKQNIGDFIEQNPQIAAKLMQSWLRGEESTGGEGRRKQK